MKFGRRRKSGDDFVECLPVAARVAGEGQVGDLRCANLVVYVSSIGLQRQGFSGDGDGFADLRDGQLRIQAAQIVGEDLYVLLHNRAERRGGERDLVDAGLEVVEGIGAG